MKATTRQSRATMIALAVGAVALVAVFMLAPAALLRGSHPRYDDHKNLIADVDTGLDAYWRSGIRELTDNFAALADYWFEWHAIKIVISALLVVVLGLLATMLWRRSFAATYTVLATSVTVLVLFSIFVLIANVQSTVVPLVALLSMVSSDHPDPALAQTLTEITAAVNSRASSPPALLTLTEHVARYNWVMIAFAAPLSVAFGVLGVVATRRFRGSAAKDRLPRRMVAILAVTGIVMTVVLLFLLTAAIIAVVDPSTALLDVLGL